MKIKLHIPQEVELSLENQKAIALNYLHSLYNWKREYVLRDECIYELEKKYHHSSFWTESKYVRDATDDDYVMASLVMKITDVK